MRETYSKLPKAGLKNVLKQYKCLKGEGNEGHETMDSLRRLKMAKDKLVHKTRNFCIMLNSRFDDSI